MNVELTERQQTILTRLIEEQIIELDNQSFINDDYSNNDYFNELKELKDIVAPNYLKF